MEFKKGYKQNDLGIFPNDWIDDNLGNVISVLTDFTANGSFASLAQNVKYLDRPNYARLVRLTDIRVGFKNDGVFITKDAYEFLSKSKLFGNELLLANVGAYTGYTFLYPNGLPFKGSLGPNMFLIKFDEIKLDPNFAYYSFTYATLLKQLLEKSASSAQPKLNKQNVRECIICYPPTKAEQTAIATALSDMDDLIHSLSTLIEKKKAIKQGAMQQLLKPKEGWVMKKLGEVFTFYPTSNYSKAEMSNEGDVGCIHYGLIHAIENSNYPLSKGIKYYVTDEQAKYEKIQDGDVIMVDASEDLVGLNKSIEISDVGKEKFIAGLHTFHLRDLNSVFVKNFRGLILNSMNIKNQMLRLAVGMKVFGVSKPQLQQILIPVPPIDVQKEIANILSDMDNEIQSLEQTLSKYQLLKQGMMQELLTGKIRLV